MQFREQRGGLAESMETLVELDDREALFKHCRKIFDYPYEPEALKVELYSTEPDIRIDWKQTYIVSIEDYGVMGFTDSNC